MVKWWLSLAGVNLKAGTTIPLNVGHIKRLRAYVDGRNNVLIVDELGKDWRTRTIPFSVGHIKGLRAYADGRNNVLVVDELCNRSLSTRQKAKSDAQRRETPPVWTGGQLYLYRCQKTVD